MHDQDTPMTADQLAARRKGVRRTAWAIGLLALAIYVAFLLSGILSK
jgi:hypothetical protein